MLDAHPELLRREFQLQSPLLQQLEHQPNAGKPRASRYCQAATGVVVHLESLLAYAIFTVLHGRFGLVSSHQTTFSIRPRRTAYTSSVLLSHTIKGSAQEKRWPRFNVCNRIDRDTGRDRLLWVQRAYHLTRSLLSSIQWISRKIYQVAD